ncbi:hypothetical protein B0T20DRAFT_215706 [Sordaria brevicollis]|uniref:Uncharacterized protein n=1 Tax=Sordaria brevicollis TaxID=83679 RepID=A0AAE0UCH5_SORBR|nr:hypothetical protein B0T20DRAFT_215706 [Sordaria brevicollis]
MYSRSFKTLSLPIWGIVSSFLSLKLHECAVLLAAERIIRHHLDTKRRSKRPKRRRLLSGKLGPGTATPPRTGRQRHWAAASCRPLLPKGPSGPAFEPRQRSREPWEQTVQTPETGVHLGVAWSGCHGRHGQTLFHLLMIRPDRSAARKLPEFRPAA